MTTHVIHSARLVSEGRILHNGWVLLAGGMVDATGTGDDWLAVAAGEDVIVTDADGAWLTPGFIDIHGHGGATASFDDGPESISRALDLHQRHGTTRAVISLVTAPMKSLARSVREIAALTHEDPRVLGSHLEGPFLDVGHKGAHNQDLLRSATPADIDLLLDAADGTLRQITIAPERAGGMDAVRAFSTAGTAVAVGHTSADYAQTIAAFEAGATILTHAFNGMDGVHHRAPGPVAAATRTPGVTLEVINDGVHVHPEVVRMLFAAAPGRIALITDAMAAAGAEDGRYHLGSLAVDVRGGVARLAEGGSIAGSTLTLDNALRRAVLEAGIRVEDAVQALTETPATALGRGAEHGRLAAGYAADAVILDDDFRVLQVFVDGAPVPR